MSKVLVVIGTGGHFDTTDLPDALRDRGVEYDTIWWNKLAGVAGKYDVAVLLGLSSSRDGADLRVRTVRAAVGPGTKLLVVSSWGRSIMAELMKQKYDAEYLGRDGPDIILTDTVLKMLRKEGCDI